MTKIPNKTRVEVIYNHKAPASGFTKHLVGKTGIIENSHEVASTKHYWYTVNFFEVNTPNYFIPEESIKVI